RLALLWSERRAAGRHLAIVRRRLRLDHRAAGVLARDRAFRVDAVAHVAEVAEVVERIAELLPALELVAPEVRLAHAVAVARIPLIADALRVRVATRATDEARAAERRAAIVAAHDSRIALLAEALLDDPVATVLHRRRGRARRSDRRRRDA